MATVSETARSGLIRRFSLSYWLKGLAARSQRPAQARPRWELEPLEPRTLLSFAPIPAPQNVPEYVVSFIRGSSRPAVASSPVGLSPSTIRAAYGYNQVQFGSVAGNGAGQTIAIVDAYNDPTIAADLHSFDQAFGLTDPNFSVVNENGGTSLPGTDPAGKGNSWAVEISLDVEWAHAAAPGANIVLVEASSASNNDLFTAVNTARNLPGVSVVSMSWGEDEFSGQASDDQYFTTPSGHTGVTFLAASGDDGSYGGNGRTMIVSYPPVSPDVIGVGGTTLTTGSGGSYVSESGWGNGTRSYSLGGSGGGISTLVRQPTYQFGVVTQSTAFRTVPDVSIDADPNSGVAVIDSWDFGTTHPWLQVGGTSLATPLWAGIVAVADQGLLIAGHSSTLDGATQTLPDLYALPASDFHDITTGNNGYAAGPGYDLVTGRGTPIVNLLVAGLDGTTAAPPTPTPIIGSFSASPSTVNAGTSVTLTAGNVTETSGSISSVAFYRESNSSSGLQTGSGGDTFLGDGVASGSTYTLSISTTGMTPGSYTYYAVAVDSKSVSSATASTSLTIAQPPPSNDNFTNATLISGASVSVTGSNVNATKQTGEPNVANDSGGKSVWWVWTASASGSVYLNTHGSNYDTTLGVYTGSSVTSLTTIASDDDDLANNTLTSAVTFHAVAGTTYHIEVDGYAGASGNIDLNLTQTLPPANDNFASAVALSGSTLTWTGSNVGATKQTGEPNITSNPGGSSVWFSWTAPTSKTVTLTTAGSNFDTILGVYTGSSLTGLTEIASNDDASYPTNVTSALTFKAVAGTTYYFSVDGYNGAQGNIRLNLS